MNLDAISPHVRAVKVNRSRGLTPAYIDPDYVFTYIKEGSACFLLEGSKHEVKKGDSILMPPHMLHIINSRGERELVEYVVSFDLFYDPARSAFLVRDKEMTLQKFIACPSDPETLLAQGPYVQTPGRAERKLVEEAFLNLKSELETRGPYFELAMRRSMLTLLCVHLRAGGSEAGRREAESLSRVKAWSNLERAIRFIHANYSRPLSLREIAKEAGLAPNYFCRLFKDYASLSAHQYLNNVRIMEAELLMREGGLNFSQIAEGVGFSSVHLFSRVFRKLRGASPSEYLGAQSLLKSRRRASSRRGARPSRRSQGA